MLSIGRTLTYCTLRTALRLALLCLVLASAGTVQGGEGAELSTSATDKHNVGSPSGTACRPYDQLWIVSTRGVGCPKSGETPPLTFAVRGPDGKWNDTTLEAFLAETAKGQTRFWIHGYGADPQRAHDVGLVAQEQFVTDTESPVRFVIWSWPSEREGRRLQDIRAKGARTHIEAYCLAWLVARMSAEADISMVGYSYGTRVIAGGLHLVGGGEICGLSLKSRVVMTAGGEVLATDMADPRQVRAVLLAAAMGSDWLVEGGFNELALGQTSELLSIYSSSDEVLRWYPLATREKHDDALGYRDLAPLPPREDGNGKFASLDMRKVIGSDHDLDTYLSHGEIAAAARHALEPKPQSGQEAGGQK